MYDTVFISSHSSSIFSLLGVLENMSEELSSIRKWICMGNSSLIMLFKCMSMSNKCIFEKLCSLDFLQTVVPGYNYSGNSGGIDIFIEKIIRIIEENDLIKPDMRLDQIEKISGYDLIFPVYDLKEEKMKLLSKSNFSGSILDVIMIQISGLGLFENYQTDGSTFCSMSNIDPIPIIQPNIYYIIESAKVKESNKTPFSYGEIYRMKEFIRRLKYRTNSLTSNYKTIYDSFYYKGENMNYSSKKTLFIL